MCIETIFSFKFEMKRHLDPESIYQVSFKNNVLKLLSPYPVRSGEKIGKKTQFLMMGREIEDYDSHSITDTLYIGQLIFPGSVVYSLEPIYTRIEKWINSRIINYNYIQLSESIDNKKIEIRFLYNLNSFELNEASYSTMRVYKVRDKVCFDFRRMTNHKNINLRSYESNVLLIENCTSSNLFDIEKVFDESSDYLTIFNLEKLELIKLTYRNYDLFDINFRFIRIELVEV